MLCSSSPSTSQYGDSTASSVRFIEDELPEAKGSLGPVGASPHFSHRLLVGRYGRSRPQRIHLR